MHTKYISKIKKENPPKLSIYRIWRKSLRTQEHVRLIHGKRAIGLRAIEVLLYLLPKVNWDRQAFANCLDPDQISQNAASDQCHTYSNIFKHIKSITKKCLYNIDPLKPHFYIVKLGLQGYTLFFLFLLKNIDCGYSLEPPHQGSSNEYPKSMFLSRNMKNIRVFYLKIFRFWR